ncbi:Hypothetical predicted protein [Paramuricea clavata]|uniref:Uncharacterized protein n=1 Tax=Paramuricea clavata TaxID=317549 RepID=A0A6S7FI23_PARCT|nr:Hypothetical predicted protein [Paramuricea clavata]
MVNDLIPATDLVKFVDDSTTWEVLHRDSQSNLPSAELAETITEDKDWSNYSAWKYIQAGVPQGTRLGPLLFLIMVNDLIPATDLVKFVDDSTTWEVLHRDSQSNLPSAELAETVSLYLLLKKILCGSLLGYETK